MWLIQQSKLQKKSFLPFFCISIILFGQSLHAQSDLKIRGNLIGSPDVLFLTNLNLLRSPASFDDAPLFEVTISNDGQEVCRVKIRFTLFSNKYNVDIVEVETREFNLLPNFPKTITNIDITSSGVDQDIQLAFFNYNAEIVSELQQQTLINSRLPNDRYVLTVQLIKIDSNESPPQIVEIIDVDYPITTDLIGPGLPVDNDFCPDIFTTFPLFSWISNADEFILTVCQVENENQSQEEVMQNEPHARLRIQKGTDFLGTPSIIYPSVGVRPLMEGKTYYWQVQTVISSPSGEVLLISEIRCFRVAKLDDIMRRLMSSGIIEVLRTLFAGTPFSDLLSEGGPLEGYSPTGTIKFNGRDIDMFDLISLLKQAAAGEIKITGVTIE